MFKVVRDILLLKSVLLCPERPTVFINSVPKSGTHLLKKVLELQGYKFRGHFYDRNSKTVKKLVAEASDDIFMTGHVTSIDRISNCNVLLVRDPAEIILSQLNYISSRPDHYLHKAHKSMGYEAFLDMLISGGDSYEGVERRFFLYLEWARRNKSFVIDYNELVNFKISTLEAAIGTKINESTIGMALQTKTMTSINKRIYGKDKLLEIKSVMNDNGSYDVYKKILSLN